MMSYEMDSVTSTISVTWTRDARDSTLAYLVKFLTLSVMESAVVAFGATIFAFTIKDPDMTRI